MHSNRNHYTKRNVKKKIDNVTLYAYKYLKIHYVIFTKTHGSNLFQRIELRGKKD